jgi:hypothetical protein
MFPEENFHEHSNSNQTPEHADADFDPGLDIFGFCLSGHRTWFLDSFPIVLPSGTGI